jgi:heptosyltransferase-2
MPSPPPLNAASSPDDTRPRTAVLMQHAGMGDLVWHVQYFRRVAEGSRDGQVTVITPPSTLARELIGHEPWVREIIDFDRRPRRSEKRSGRHSGLLGLWRMGMELRSRRLERIALFTTHPGRALVSCLLAGIGQRLGYGSTWLQRRLLTTTPWITRYRGPALPPYKDATAFAIAQGWTDAPIVPRLAARADALERMRERLAALPRPLHAFAIGASEPYKQWGDANFAELATTLARQGHGVLMLGGPGESELADKILARLAPEHRARVMAVTRGTVAETVAAMALVDACVGNDTGATNIAAAMGRPTVVLLGAGKPLEHDPQAMQLLRSARLSDITPPEVAQHAAHSLARAGAARTEAP